MRAVPSAWAFVVPHLGRLERRYVESILEQVPFGEDVDYDELTAEVEADLAQDGIPDDTDFDHDVVFSDDDWRQWMPDAPATTAAWLAQVEPDLAERFLRSDSGWGFDYEPVARLWASDRTAVESALTEAGYVVVPWEPLAITYLHPPANVVALLNGLRRQGDW